MASFLLSLAFRRFFLFRDAWAWCSHMAHFLNGRWCTLGADPRARINSSPCARPPPFHAPAMASFYRTPPHRRRQGSHNHSPNMANGVRENNDPPKTNEPNSRNANRKSMRRYWIRVRETPQTNTRAERGGKLKNAYATYTTYKNNNKDNAKKKKKECK